MIGEVHDPREQHVVLAPPRRRRDVAHVRRFARKHIANIEADPRMHGHDFEQRCPCTLERDGGRRLARRQRAPAGREEALDQAAAVDTSMAVMNVRDRNARFPRRPAADLCADLAREVRCADRERSQLLPRGQVVRAGERNRARRITDDRQPAEMNAVGRARDLDEPVLATAARADRTGERRTAALAFALTTVRARRHRTYVPQVAPGCQGSKGSRHEAAVAQIGPGNWLLPLGLVARKVVVPAPSDPAATDRVAADPDAAGDASAYTEP
jgi:hypothetical protein